MLRASHYHLGGVVDILYFIVRVLIAMNLFGGINKLFQGASFRHGFYG